MKITHVHIKLNNYLLTYFCHPGLTQNIQVVENFDPDFPLVLKVNKIWLVNQGKS